MTDKLFDKKRRNFKVVSRYPGKPDVLFDPSRRNFRLDQPDGGYGTITMSGKFPDRKYWRQSGRAEGGVRGGFGIVPNAADPDFNLSEVFGDRGASGYGGQGRTPGGYSAHSQWRTSPEGRAEAHQRKMELAGLQARLEAQKPIIKTRKVFDKTTGEEREEFVTLRPVYGDPNDLSSFKGHEEMGLVGGKNTDALESFRAAAEEEAKKQDQLDLEQSRRERSLTRNPPRDAWMPPEPFQSRKRQAFEFAPHRSYPSVYPPVQAPAQGQLSTTKLSRSRLFDKFNNPRWGLRWGERYGVEYPNWGRDWKNRGR